MSTIGRAPDGRFKKGFHWSEEAKAKMCGRIPWNKGLKGIHLSPATEFGINNPSPNTGKHTAPEILKERARKYRQRYWQRPEVRERRNKRQRERRLNDPQFRIDDSMRSLIRISLRGKKAGRKWETLVDYTIVELMQYLETLFNENMAWDNYGSYWEIDHIKPRSLFNYETEEDKEFQECWALSNLQPLEASENRRKGNTFVETPKE